VSVAIPFDVRRRIEDLVYDSARFIDDERFEEWAELFVERCVYKITTRENFDASLPVGVMYCDSRAMLRDRVLSLRKANLYNPHYDRHLVSNVCVLGVADAVYDVHSSYLVLQTTPAGESRVFSCGKYLDRVVFEGESARFQERIVVMDTGAIFNLLATPV
jgi:anthranilate 1,2-dioxygenase small subunit